MLSDEATSMAMSTMNIAVPSSPEGRRSALAAEPHGDAPSAARDVHERPTCWQTGYLLAAARGCLVRQGGRGRVQCDEGAPQLRTVSLKALHVDEDLDSLLRVRLVDGQEGEDRLRRWVVPDPAGHDGPAARGGGVDVGQVRKARCPPSESSFHWVQTGSLPTSHGRRLELEVLVASCQARAGSPQTRTGAACRAAGTSAGSRRSESVAAWVRTVDVRHGGDPGHEDPDEDREQPHRRPASRSGSSPRPACPPSRTPSQTVAHPADERAAAGSRCSSVRHRDRDRDRCRHLTVEIGDPVGERPRPGRRRSRCSGSSSSPRCPAPRPSRRSAP